MTNPVPSPPKPSPSPAAKSRRKVFTPGSRVATLDGRTRGRVIHRQRNGLCTVEWEEGEVTKVHETALIARYTEQSENAGRKF